MRIIPVIIYLLAIVFMTGCDIRKPQWRTYEEVNLEGHNHQHSDAPSSMPAAKSFSLRWTTPDGWKEQAGSGMRIATLTVGGGDAVATCTLITLGGAAGGLEANVRRWFNQLNLAIPEAGEFSAFLDKQERIQSEGGFEGVLVNMTGFGPATDGSSMLAGLFSVNNTTLFIKMTGPLDLLMKENGRFTQLCKSLRPDA